MSGHIDGEHLEPARYASLEYSTTPADTGVNDAVMFFLVVLTLVLLACSPAIVVAAWSAAF